VHRAFYPDVFALDLQPLSEGWTGDSRIEWRLQILKGLGAFDDGCPACRSF
jgi:hypothetical protein